MAVSLALGERQVWALLFAAMAAFMLGMKALLGYWVYRDASARGSSNPAFWGVGVAVIDLIVVPYLYNRWRRLGKREHSRTHRDRVVETVLVASFPALLGGMLFAPPDAFSMPLFTLGLLAVTIPLSYVLVYRDGYTRLRARV